jgi:hypothetical protein
MSFGKKVLQVIEEKAFLMSSITNRYLSYLTLFKHSMPPTLAKK